MDTEHHPASPEAGQDGRGGPAEFYDRFAPAVYGLISQIVGERDTAAQVTCDVLVHAWNSSGPDPAHDTPLCHVLTLAHREAVDAAPEHPAGSSPADRVQDNPAVSQLLAALPASDRRAVVAAYFGAQTYRAIAHAQDVSPDTVNTHLRDGMTHLHAQAHSHDHCPSHGEHPHDDRG